MTTTNIDTNTNSDTNTTAMTTNTTTRLAAVALVEVTPVAAAAAFDWLRAAAVRY